MKLCYPGGIAQIGLVAGVDYVADVNWWGFPSPPYFFPCPPPQPTPLNNPPSQPHPQAVIEEATPMILKTQSSLGPSSGTFLEAPWRSSRADSVAVAFLRAFKLPENRALQSPGSHLLANYGRIALPNFRIQIHSLVNSLA